MKIYHYHPQTGAYLGEGVADADPLQPGQWLLPAHATADAPPAVFPGHVLAFEAGYWVQQAVSVVAQEVPPTPDPRAQMLMQIAALEATVTQRRLREAMLGTDSGWLAAVDVQIAALRSQL